MKEHRHVFRSPQNHRRSVRSEVETGSEQEARPTRLRVLDKLGQWIVSCHAKDVAWNLNPQMQFEEVVLGTGTLDYRTYLTRLASLSQDVPLMIEHMKDADQYDRSRQHVFAVGKEVGVVFE